MSCLVCGRPPKRPVEVLYVDRHQRERCLCGKRCEQLYNDGAPVVAPGRG